MRSRVRSANKSAIGRSNAGGFTLIEIVVVITLLVVISALAISRFDSLLSWRQRSDIRRFIDTWQFLSQESLARREGYRILINLNDQSYTVRREVIREPGETEQVDLLRGLRTESEKKRLEEEDQKLLTFEEEEREEEKHLGESVETLYYQALFGDPNESVRLTRPPEFPSLAEKISFTDGLRVRDVSTRAGKITEGIVALRFSPRGGTDFAVVHFKLEGSKAQIYTVTLNPTTGEMKLVEDDIDLDWSAINRESTSQNSISDGMRSSGLSNK